MAEKIEASDNLASYCEGTTGNCKELDTTNVVKEVKEYPQIKKDAENIFVNGDEGDVLRYMCNSCSLLHADDKNIIRALFLSYASVFVKNCNGINIEITGSAGSGKSHVVKTVLKHIPDNSKIKAKLSDKALYYHSIEEGTILAYDDQDLSEDMQSTVKNLSWDEPTELLTVKQQAKLSLSIPARCPYWNTKVEGCGDEQIQDRVIKFWADESEEHKKKRDEMENEYLVNPSKLDESSYSAKVTQAIWNIIRGDNLKSVNKYTVSIPFANRIKGGNGDARTRNLFIAIIQASCVLNMNHRDRDANGFIIATEYDFNEAENIINPLMRNIGGSQGQKLNRSAMRVLDVLKEKASDTYTYEFLMKWCGLTKAQLSHAVNGRRSDGLDGLVAKCPAVNTTNLTTTKVSGYTKDIETGIEGETCTRLSSSRIGVIWNKEMFEAWNSGEQNIFYLTESDEPCQLDPAEEEYLYQSYMQTTEVKE